MQEKTTNYSAVFNNDLTNKILFITIAICSTWFFKLRGLGKGERVFELLGLVLIFLFLILWVNTFRNKVPVKRHFTFVVVVFMMSVLFSGLSCWYFNHQSLGDSLYQSRHLFYILFYPLLHYLLLKPEWIKEFIFYFSITAAAIYVLQYFAYPFKITEAKMFVDRGTLRINLPAGVFRDLGYFMCVDMFFQTNKKKYAYGALLILVVAILSAFRSIIAIYIGLAVIYLLINNRVKNKIMIVMMAVLVAIAGFIVFQDIIQAMIKWSEKEQAEGSDYIRVQAGNYYMNEILKNPIAGFLGNGPPDPSSSYGAKSTYNVLFNSYYLSDIGIIGSFYKFGLPFIVLIVFVMFKLVFIKLPPEYNFVRLFSIKQILVLLISGSVFEDESGIVAFCIIFYLIDCERHKLAVENSGAT